MSDSTFTESHRLFHSYIRLVRTIPSSQASQILSQLRDPLLDSSDDDPPPIDDIVADINAAIGIHGFSIIRKVDEVTQELVYIYINTINDDLARLATPYSPSELGCIKHIIDDIIEAENRAYSIGYQNGCRLAKEHLNCTVAEAQFFVRRLVDDGWFEISDEQLFLSQRAISELRTWLGERYGDLGSLAKCSQCNDWVITSGLRVEAESFHKPCFTVFQRNNPTVTAIPFGPMS